MSLLKEGYIGDCSRLIRGILGVVTIAHIMAQLVSEPLRYKTGSRGIYYTNILARGVSIERRPRAQGYRPQNDTSLGRCGLVEPAISEWWG